MQMHFDLLKSRWPWRPIPNCPGRFVLTGGPNERSIAELLGTATESAEFQVAGATDPVVVTRLIDGGLISYRKGNGQFLHTLNTLSGFERKLRQLGIEY